MKTHQDFSHVSCEHVDRNRSTSSFGHNRTLEVYTKSKVQKTVSNVETQDITWKTHNGGKNHDSPQAVNNHYMRGNTESKRAQRQQPLSSSSPRAAAVTRWRQRPLYLSLSLSLTYALFTTLQKQYIQLSNTKNVCPKSYLYIYDFSAYLHFCPSNRSVPIGAGSVMSRFSAAYIRFHPEGHVSQQLYDLNLIIS